MIFSGLLLLLSSFLSADFVKVSSKKEEEGGGGGLNWGKNKKTPLAPHFPPGRFLNPSRTRSSPPKPRKTRLNKAAPIRMTKIIDVIFKS